MVKMVEFTSTETHGKINVNIDMILSVAEKDRGAMIVFSEDLFFKVKETVQEVLQAIRDANHPQNYNHFPSSPHHC